MMSQLKSAVLAINDGDSQSDPDGAPSRAETLRARARELATNLAWVPSVTSSDTFANRCQTLSKKLGVVIRTIRREQPEPSSQNILRENTALLEASFNSVYDSLSQLHEIPHALGSGGNVIPRILIVAEESLLSTGYRCDEEMFFQFVDAFQEVTVLDLLELRVLPVVMKLVLLEYLARNAGPLGQSSEATGTLAVCLESLRKINYIPWRDVIEPLIAFDSYLEQDPVDAYVHMDAESRDLYRNEIAYIAKRSDFSELEVARAALELAQRAHRTTYQDSRLAERVSHVGYYLIAEGADSLKRKVGFHPDVGHRLRKFVKAHPDDFYLSSIAFLTITIAATAISLSGFDYWSFGTYVLLLLILILPCSEDAVQIVNYLVLAYFKPQRIPKLDFANGIPSNCATLVTVPTLLLDESQARKVVDDLEVRFLGNQDPNLHFALLTDLPDSATQPGQIDSLATLCASLVKKLNDKYVGHEGGSFFLFHRARKYNPRERIWMGWERKRGKLLELNRFLSGLPEDYAATVGNMSTLSSIRYVIALDADTLLPRDSARRMIGALSHPLNRAIIDPASNIVVAGYGILQPRAGISIRSAGRSRLAKIWSGQTGLDVYSCAVSDVYQDLYGEGTYVGKGIYEVETLHRVLDGRFPSNLLLSHDLIEGAYARSGLVSDIELIEGYPTFYSAYNRRKHRWLRGDWQIAEWLLSRVPGPHGRKTENPISLVSKWKIFDNLRRGLVEPATFLLFVLGWLVLPGSAAFWTLATVCLLFLPNILRFMFQAGRALLRRNPDFVRTLPDSLFAANVGTMLTLIFLAHQTLLSIDAMIRSLVRRLVTRRRMLEWVTSGEDEVDGANRTSLDAYLDWTPALAIVLGAIVWFIRGKAVFAALPILLLWAGSKWLSTWLDRSPHTPYEVSDHNRVVLRRVALRTWRFFNEFSNVRNNWLIPDNANDSTGALDQRLSPTNLGFLLDSRLVACQLGYLTLPEFVELTQKTLATAMSLPRYHGHFFNWYNNESLEALRPLIVSSVDSGNLVASLWALEQGALEQLYHPLIDSRFIDGVVDRLHELVREGVFTRSLITKFVRESQLSWFEAIENIRVGLQCSSKLPKREQKSNWNAENLALRIESINAMLKSYLPWLLPEYSGLRQTFEVLGVESSQTVPLESLPDFIDALQIQLASLPFLTDSTPDAVETNRLRQELLRLLPEARANITKLIQNLTSIASDAAKLAANTDFSILLNSERKLLAIAVDADTQQLTSACYDQLASEARVATFVAIAKNEIPQEVWFALERVPKAYGSRTVLLSWAGTMFEYLMPCLWMHTFPDTLLERAAIEAVRTQRDYAGDKRVPWGISESASSQQQEDGSYAYFAYGVPQLALRQTHPDELVISPYSTMLALHVETTEALKNLHKMERSGWIGSHGPFDAVDFTKRDGGGRSRPAIVPLWMAHHQGMTLLALANAVCSGVVRNWFHKNQQVQSAELLLQERPIRRTHVRPRRLRAA
jgi:hypothetical protein